MLSTTKNLTRKALEARARRAAESVGLRARKSRNHFIDNAGGFQLVDLHGSVIAGRQFELTAEDVLEFCRRYPEESKFDLGNFMRWDERWPATPTISQAAQAYSWPYAPQIQQMAAALASPQAEPAQPETDRQSRISESEVELEKYRKWGFGGPAELELVPRPDSIFTFEEVRETLGYKTVAGVDWLAEKSDYPEQARKEGLITAKGCGILQELKRARRRKQNTESYKRTKQPKETAKAANRVKKPQ